jgi:ABC-2 type transport system permease protein
MVATVLKLRYRALFNTLARRPWQLVGFIFGVLWGFGILASVTVAIVFLSLSGSLESVAAVGIVGGSALVLGWVLAPVVVTGMDTSIDARRLAQYPFTRRQTMLALAGTGATGIPGIVTILVGLISLLLWLRWPLAALAGVPAVALGVATCVIASRLVAELTGGVGGNRRGREIIGSVVLVAVMLAGPIITGVLALLDSGIGDRFGVAADILPLTPLGAAWGVAPAVAAGDGLAALSHAGIAAASLAFLWWMWSRAVDRSTTAPPRQTSRSVAAGKLGLFGVMPTGGVGATWARSLSAWLRDPRYLRQLLVVPVFPILFAFIGGVEGFGFAASPVLVAFMLALAGYTDLSYDGTAYATVLATGVRGRDDRLGRLLGAACIGIPLVVIASIVTAVLGGDTGRIPLVLGTAVGVLLVGYGVSAVTSAMIITPVAAPGDSPFKSVPGQTFVGGLLVFVVWAVIGVLSLPFLVLAVVGMVQGVEPWGTVTLAAGLIVGAGVACLGVFVGGRTFDRSGPELFARIRSLPT